MGLKEEQDRERSTHAALSGKTVKVRTSFSLKSLLLFPYFVWKNYMHRREVRKSLLKNMFEDQGE